MKVKNLNKLKILVIGDIILDKYVSGNVNRISPEAPIPVLNVSKTFCRLGGAANVSNNLKSIGVDTYLIGRISNDENGIIIENLLNDLGINNLLIKDKRSKTICKTRIISSSQQIVRIDNEEIFYSNNKDENIIHNHLKINNFDCIIISDYNKGFITDGIMKVIKNSNCRIIADPKPNNIELYKNIHSITPNQIEAEAISKMTNIDKIGTKIKNDLSTNVIITRGDKGVSVYEKLSSKGYHIPTQSNNVIDVSGAGDTFISVYSTFISLDHSIEDSVKIANNACGLVIKKTGTAPITFHDLILSNSEIFEKRVTLSNLKLHLKNFNDKKIVFTNGCFDILHRGHISLLKKSKTYGDILIVGLNSDESVKKIKGNDRPVNDQDSRNEVLSAISYVDYIIIFNEETPINLIKEIKPDILVKGADYKLNEVVGHNFIKEYGGEVKLVEIIKGHSSSNIIEKLKN